MMPLDFARLIVRLLAALGLLLWSSFSVAEVATQSDCRTFKPATDKRTEAIKYSDALLWKVSRAGSSDSYIFGTIHVSDPRITALPAPVSERLNSASVYAMEALPVPEEAVRLSQMMFFSDGTTLTDYLDQDLFARAARILSNYQFSSESAVYLRPWAAFLIMNYPVEEGVPLDLQLLDIARQNGAELHGLETLSEQGSVFSGMAEEEQLQLLMDTLCNYDHVTNDFEQMKLLYLDRDLQGLFDYSNKYSFADEPIYKNLMQRLLTDRNHTMAKRMRPILEKGNAFIAIGAMHLPGHEGVLSLLEGQGYTITSVY